MSARLVRSLGIAGRSPALGPGGSIVDISSFTGRRSDRGYVAYGTAKAALARLTRPMAEDCAPRIRVNAIAVGSIGTPRMSACAPCTCPPMPGAT